MAAHAGQDGGPAVLVPGPEVEEEAEAVPDEQFLPHPEDEGG